MNTPIFITDEKELAQYSDNNAVTLVDAFLFQLKELFFIDNPTFYGQPKDEVFKTEEYKKYVKEKKGDFIHVFFPWNQHLVKTATEDDYYRLKTNRNKDLITSLEQKELREKRVAVFGLSVGSNIAFLLSQAGISNTLTVADFDELDTTNLNRIFGGVHQIGLNKTTVVARRLYEDNPFVKPTLLSEGINAELLEDLLSSGSLDLIIEEVDDFPFKIMSRALAMKYKVPVLMVTDNGDGVVLHVERYDLGHNLIFGRQFDFWKAKLSGPRPTLRQVSDVIINEIVGGREKVDPRMLQSVEKVVSGNLLSWPQLGSAAMLAGVTATIFTKRILLGENKDVDIRQTIFIPEKNLDSHGGEKD